MKIQLIEGPVTNEGTQTAVGVMTVEQLYKTYKADIYDASRGRTGEGGYQRQPKKTRYIQLAERMSKGLVVATSILVNVRDPQPKKLEFDSKGRVEIDLPKTFWAEDGMHRAKAWIHLYENAEQYGLDQEEVGKRKINFVTYWGSSIVEEAMTFFDVNTYSKSIPTGNRLELEAFLTRNSSLHDGDNLIAELDDIVHKLAETPQWKDKIQWPNEASNVIPNSALIRSLLEIFGDKKSVLRNLKKNEKLNLLNVVWEAVSEVFPEIFTETDKKKYSLQKAIGVTVVHRLIPEIYTDILQRNMSIFSKKDKIEPENVQVWKEYLMKMRNYTDTNSLNKPVDGINFWLSGKEGGAGQYSSGAGRNTLSDFYSDEVLGS